MNQSVLVEACVDSVATAREAQAGGARRLELCDLSEDGGVTPSVELIAEVRRIARVPLHVLIRPRAGDFRYSESEIGAMRHDIEACQALGAHGVAIGALTRSGGIDLAALRALIRAARPLAITFHRAFDATRDPGPALEDLIEHEIERVLTAGSAAGAEAGIPGLRELVRRAAGRIVVMAGGGVRATNALRIVRETGVRELHSTGGHEGVRRIVERLGAG